MTESFVGLIMEAPELAADIEGDGTQYGSILHAAKQRKKGAKHGRLREGAWSDVRFALRDAPSDKDRLQWIEARDKEDHRMLNVFKALVWSEARDGDTEPMSIAYPSNIKNLGDLHNVKKKVRMVANMPKKQYELRMGVPEGGWNSFAATIDFGTAMLLLSICVELRLEIYQLDVVAAYLNAPAPRPNLIFKPPAHLTPPDPSKPFLRAEKAIYGFPESGRAWYLMLLDIFKALGFKPANRNSTFLHRVTSKGLIVIGTVVDDCLAGASSVGVWTSFLEEIGKHVPVDADKLEHFIGICADYDKKRGRLVLHQKPLIDIAMERFNINPDCRKIYTPIATSTVISTDDCPEVPDADRVLQVRCVLGTAMYIANTRHDIKMAVNALARVASNPSKAHLDAALRIIIYLHSTREVPLVLSRGSWTTPDGLIVPSGQMVVYVDASYADSPVSARLRSRTGVALMRGGAVISSISRLQEGVSTSSCHAEIVAMFTASKEVMSALQDLERLEMPHIGPVWMMEDSSSAISVMSGAGNSSGANSRHFLVKYFYTAELAEQGIIKIIKVRTDDQLADGLTKPLARAVHERLRHFTQGLSAFSKAELSSMGLPYFEASDGEA